MLQQAAGIFYYIMELWVYCSTLVQSLRTARVLWTDKSLGTSVLSYGKINMNIFTFPVIMLCWVPAGISPLKGWPTCVGRLRLWAWGCGGVCCKGGWRDCGRAIKGWPADPKLGKESCDPGIGTVTWNKQNLINCVKIKLACLNIRRKYTYVYNTVNISCNYFFMNQGRKKCLYFYPLKLQRKLWN